MSYLKDTAWFVGAEWENCPSNFIRVCMEKNCKNEKVMKTVYMTYLTDTAWFVGAEWENCPSNFIRVCMEETVKMKK